MTGPEELNRSQVSQRRIVLTCAFLTFFLLTVPLAVTLYKMGVFSNEPSVADIFVSIHLIHLKENTFSEIGMKPFLKPYLDSSNCADRQMKNIIRNSISDALTGPDTLLKQIQMNCAKNCVKILSFFLLIRTV